MAISRFGNDEVPLGGPPRKKPTKFEEWDDSNPRDWSPAQQSLWAYISKAYEDPDFVDFSDDMANPPEIIRHHIQNKTPEYQQWLADAHMRPLSAFPERRFRGN